MGSFVPTSRFKVLNPLADISPRAFNPDAPRDADMTTIKASCPMCADVTLTPIQIKLVVSNRAELTNYSFSCPQCQERVTKSADDDVVALLISGGVSVERWDLPAEALEEHTGAPLTYDELLDFALLLSHDDLLAASLQTLDSERA